jgi:hypothetical protein
MNGMNRGQMSFAVAPFSSGRKEGNWYRQSTKKTKRFTQ